MKRFISFFLFLQLLFVTNIFSQTQPSVGEILNADGTIRLDRDGGYDVEGYKMLIDKDGKPRFLSKTETALSDSGSWSSVGTGSSNGVSGGESPRVYALAVYNGELYVAGRFDTAGGIQANNIARWNGTSWNSVGTGAANGVNGTVKALVVFNGNLIVGGNFTAAGGISINSIATWNGTNWGTIGSIDFQNIPNINPGTVEALTVYNGELYATGYFTRAGGVNANNIARYNGTNWNSLGNGSNNGVSTYSFTLCVYNGELYVGGEFSQAGGLNVNYIARWNGTNWNTVGTGLNVGVSSAVASMIVYNNELYIGGYFTTAGGVSANHIARWNGSSWNTLGTGTNNGVNGSVSEMAVYNGELYVGGGFTDAGGVSANRIARWNGTSWNTLGTGSANGVNNYVFTLAIYNGELYVGGRFTQAGGVNSNYIARWTISGATNIEENEITPTNVVLHQNYPNPFNPSTTISFTIPKSSYVTLKVYDVLGREVAELVNNELQAGSHSINFDASRLSSGTYFYRLQAGDFTQVKKMILIK